jgi:flagellar biosynthesis protein FlhA
MAKIIKNYVLEVLKPLDMETLKNFKTAKQDRDGMKIIPTDIMRLEVGAGLIPLVDKNLEFNLLDRIKKMRKDIEEEIGISIPLIHILSNFELKQFEYSFFIRGREVVKYEIKQNSYLCLSNGTIKYKIEGKNIKDPVFGLPALLINKKQVKEAGEAGYVIADAPCIIMTNLEYLIKINISEIFTYDGSRYLLKKIGETHPLLIEDCFSKFKPSVIKKVLTMILEKKTNLCNIDRIIELLLFYSEKEKDMENIVKLILKDL